MKIIVISPTRYSISEPEIVTQMFRNGLELFHLRKPRFSFGEVKEYLNQIPAEFMDRIVIHSHYKLAVKYNLKGIHLTRKDRKSKFRTWLKISRLKMKKTELSVTTSFHSLNSLFEDERSYAYVFLSPIFDSISKKNYQSKFKGHNLKVIMSKAKHKVIALGGVNIDKVEQIIDMNFAGMALFGAIWESDDPLASFLNIKKACQKETMSLV